jgi:hypothetical protein
MISMYFMGFSLDVSGALIAPSYLRVERRSGRSTRHRKKSGSAFGLATVALECQKVLK